MEVCDTLCGHWFWEPGDSPRPLRLLYRLYSSCRSRGANFLLDVGPDRTGRIPDASVARLMELKAAIDSKAGLPTSLAMNRPATASNIYHNDPSYGPDKAVDEPFRSRWATDESQTSAWLEVDLGSGVTVDSGFVREAFDHVHAFEIQVPEGQGWRTIYTGGAIGDSGVEFSFKPERTTRIRLNITNSVGGPTIWEFEVYGKRVE
jgi:alpha-L-fucosidase